MSLPNWFETLPLFVRIDVCELSKFGGGLCHKLKMNLGIKKVCYSVGVTYQQLTHNCVTIKERMSVNVPLKLFLKDTNIVKETIKNCI